MTSENEKGGWGIPKSAVMNFAALVTLFVVIFSFHGLGTKLISEKSNSGTATEVAALPAMSADATSAPAAGKDTDKTADDGGTMTASGKEILKQAEGNAAPELKNKPRKRIESDQAASVQNVRSGPAGLTVTIEDLDGDAARQEYLVSNQNYVPVARPSAAPVAAPTPPAQEDDFIPFERKKN